MCVYVCVCVREREREERERETERESANNGSCVCVDVEGFSYLDDEGGPRGIRGDRTAAGSVAHLPQSHR